MGTSLIYSQTNEQFSRKEQNNNVLAITIWKWQQYSTQKKLHDSATVSTSQSMNQGSQHLSFCIHPASAPRRIESDSDLILAIRRTH